MAERKDDGEAAGIREELALEIGLRRPPVPAPCPRSRRAGSGSPRSRLADQASPSGEDSSEYTPQAGENPPRPSSKRTQSPIASLHPDRQEGHVIVGELAVLPEPAHPGGEFLRRSARWPATRPPHAPVRCGQKPVCQCISHHPELIAALKISREGRDLPRERVASQPSPGPACRPAAAGRESRRCARWERRIATRLRASGTGSYRRWPAHATARPLREASPGMWPRRRPAQFQARAETHRARFNFSLPVFAQGRKPGDPVGRLPLRLR